MRAALLFLALLPLPAASLEARDVESILRHGPWPPALERDPTNPVSGRPEAIALGERLFFEPRLSGTGAVLCATCHAPFRRFQDGRARAFGLGETDRNTPTLLDVRFHKRFGWDGNETRLWAQSLRPLAAPLEMNASAAQVAALVRRLYAPAYEAAFGHAPSADDARVLDDVGKALAAFQETLVSARTPFDAYRDALAAGRGESAAYPPEARRGLALFVRQCSRCHEGPLFTSSEMLAGRRIPGLRGVDATAPYMHDGRHATLHEAVRQHPHRSHPLGEKEVSDLAAFLETL